MHVNALVTAVDWTTPDPTAGLGPCDVARLRAGAAEWAERSGYATIQSTRPQTLAYALTDSPLGLLAWNLEWFVDYDPARTVQTRIDPDAFLTDVSIFWFTRTCGAFYGGTRVEVPTAVAVFPGDGALRALAERSLHVVRWTEYERGGHFASLQAPDLLVADIQAFVRELPAQQ